MWVGDEFIYISSPFSLFSSYSFHHHIHRIHRPHHKVDYSSKRRFLPKDRAIHQDLIIYPRAQWCFHFRMTEAQFLTKDFISTHLNLTFFHIWMLVPCRYLKWIFQKIVLILQSSFQDLCELYRFRSPSISCTM